MFLCVALLGLPVNAGDMVKQGLPVRSLAVELQDTYLKERIFTGRIEATRVSDAGFEASGKVASIFADEGDVVVQGSVLAVLDRDQLIVQRKEASATLKQAEVSFKLAETTLKRIESVLSAEGVSRQQFDEALSNRNALASSVERAKAALERIEVNIEKSTLYAPFDGVVTRRFMDEGRVITVGTPVVSLQENVATQARVSLANGLADGYQVDAATQLTVKNQVVQARVKSILAKRDERMQTVDVVFALDDSVAARPGDLVELRVAVPVEEQGMWLPISALTETVRGLWSVYFIDGDNLAQRKVLEVIYQTNDKAFVRGALQDGDQIVSVGTHRIVPGQLLRVVEETRLAIGS